jgi:uncharacterized protein involved in exopolysaccharide biosynthesis
MSGSSAPLTDSVSEESGGEINGDASELYPPLRQLPRLAVPYTNLYRQVQIQEAVFELLTQQYELARIQEAKDVPVVSVIDAPGIPEKKSFPPRLLLTLLLTLFSIGATCALVLMHHRWSLVRPEDPRKRLAAEIAATLRASLKRKETKREALQ